MRSLTPGRLAQLVHEPLGSIASAFLEDAGIEDLGEALAEEGRLESLSLAGNRLARIDDHHLRPVLATLWWLDLSSNRLEDVRGLEHCVALGRLELRHNRLTADALFGALRDVALLRCGLAGNEALGKPGSRAYLLRALAAVPNTWCLDDHYVPIGHVARVAIANAEAARQPKLQAAAAAAAAADEAAPDAAPAAPADAAPVPAMSLLRHMGRDDTWEFGKRSAAPRGRLAAYLKAARGAPASTRVAALDAWRLAQLASEYDDETAFAASVALRHTGGLGKASRRPAGARSHRNALLASLNATSLLDVAALLAATLHHSLPRKLLGEALHALLVAAPGSAWSAPGAGDRPPPPAFELSALPAYAITALVKALADAALALVEADLLPEDPVRRALDAAVARALTAAPVVRGAKASDPTRGMEVAERAVRLFLDAPSCPQQPGAARKTDATGKRKGTNNAAQEAKLAAALFPLFCDAGAGGGAVSAAAAPPRSPGGGGSSALYSDNWRQHMAESLLGSEDGAPADDVGRLRRPRLAETVLVDAGGGGVYTPILAVSDDGADVVVRGFRGINLPPWNGINVLLRQHLMWDPRGWWIHVHAAAQLQRSSLAPADGAGSVGAARGGATTRLFRAGDPSRLHASGVPCEAGVANVRVPRCLVDTSPAETGLLGGPKKVRLFSSDQSWDAAFVLAAPKAVAAQNAAVQSLGGGAPTWSKLEDAPFAVSAVVPLPGAGMAPQVRPLLAPARSQTHLAPMVLALSRESGDAGDYGYADEDEYADEYGGGGGSGDGGRRDDGQDEWATLQREMGTFREPDEAAGTLPPLNVQALQQELRERRYREAARLEEAADDDGGGGRDDVFNLTTIGDDDDAGAAAAAPPPSAELNTSGTPLVDDVGATLEPGVVPDATFYGPTVAAARLAASRRRKAQRAWHAIGGKTHLVVDDPPPSLAHHTWDQRGADSASTATGTAGGPGMYSPVSGRSLLASNLGPSAYAPPLTGTTPPPSSERRTGPAGGGSLASTMSGGRLSLRSSAAHIHPGSPLAAVEVTKPKLSTALRAVTPADGRAGAQQGQMATYKALHPALTRRPLRDSRKNTRAVKTEYSVPRPRGGFEEGTFGIASTEATRADAEREALAAERHAHHLRQREAAARQHERARHLAAAPAGDEAGGKAAAAAVKKHTKPSRLAYRLAERRAAASGTGAQVVLRSQSHSVL